MANTPFNMGYPPVKGLFYPEIPEDPQENPVTNPDPMDYAAVVAPQPTLGVSQTVLGSPEKFKGNRLGYRKQIATSR